MKGIDGVDGVSTGKEVKQHLAEPAVVNQRKRCVSKVVLMHLLFSPALQEVLQDLLRP